MWRLETNFAKRGRGGGRGRTWTTRGGLSLVPKVGGKEGENEMEEWDLVEEEFFSRIRDAHEDQSKRTKWKVGWDGEGSCRFFCLSFGLPCL